MPRKHLDIIKDLFIAHQEKDEKQYQELAKEFIRYLRWKGWNNKTDEFAAILQPKKKDPFINRKTEKELTLFGVEEKPTPKKVIKKKNKTTWQVARGAKIDFIQTQRLIDELIRRNKFKYSNEVLSDITGYSKEKAQGFSRLLYYLGLLEDQTKKPTKLACIIYQYDPYFEDVGTLWFLHYYISSQSNLIIWNRLANHLFIRSEFDYKEVPELFKQEKERHTEYSFKHHLRKEFKVTTEAYIESEFQNLNLFYSDKKDHFIKTKPTTVPDEIVLSGILLFKKRYYTEESTLEIKNLMNKENTPVRLFCLQERKFRESLERLRVKNLITIESFADLDQIKFVKTDDYLLTLKNYYENRSGE